MEKQAQQQEYKIDPKNAMDIVCKECDSKVFVSAFYLKHVSALVSPNGRDMLVPISIFQCSKCKAIPEMFISDNVS